jgi:hypothetical protein
MLIVAKSLINGESFSITAAGKDSRLLFANSRISPHVLSSAKYSSLSKYSLISLFFFETTNAIRNVTSNFTPTFVAVYINALSDSILVTGASYFSFESLWPSLR